MRSVCITYSFVYKTNGRIRCIVRRISTIACVFFDTLCSIFYQFYRASHTTQFTFQSESIVFLDYTTVAAGGGAINVLAVSQIDTHI